jgi:hypothetical protein
MNAIVQENNGVAAYDEFRAKITEVKEACNFIPDVTSDEGYEKSKRIALDVGKILTALEKKRKDLKAESLEYGRKVDAEAKSIAEELASFQLPHKEAYKELDNLRKEREANRKANHEQRIESMKGLRVELEYSTSDEIKAALESLKSNDCSDFDEYVELAKRARDDAIESLTKHLSAKLKHEQEQAELARLRAEDEARKQKEHEERIANEAREQAERAAAEKIEAERRAKAAAEQAAKDAAESAERAAKEAAERAEREKQEAVERAEREAQERADKAEADRLAAIEAERLAEEKRQANKRHAAKINNAAVKGICEAADITQDQAKAIVVAIAKGAVPHTTISY